MKSRLFISNLKKDRYTLSAIHDFFYHTTGPNWSVGKMVSKAECSRIFWSKNSLRKPTYQEEYTRMTY